MPRLPWTIGYVSRMSAHVTPASAWRLRGMVLRAAGKRPPRPGRVAVRVRRPFRADVHLREPGSDLTTFSQVVVGGLYQLAAERAAPCEYVLDLGGNIGLATLYLAAAFPACRLLTVEPSAANRDVLAANLAGLVAAGRVQVCGAAVWGEDTVLALSEPPGGDKFDAIRVADRAAGDGSAAVPGRTVDTLLRTAGFPRADLVKMDIEGAETAVFRGPTDWLGRVNAIAVEFHGDSRAASGFDAVVTAAGFVVEEDRVQDCAVAYRPAGRRVG